MEERRLQLAQLDGGDAQGPDVTQLIVATFALHGGHLWGHPGGKLTYEMARGLHSRPPPPQPEAQPHQYGVPMKDLLLATDAVSSPDTPKSAAGRKAALTPPQAATPHPRPGHRLRMHLAGLRQQVAQAQPQRPQARGKARFPPGRGRPPSSPDPVPGPGLDSIQTQPHPTFQQEGRTVPHSKRGTKAQVVKRLARGQAGSQTPEAPTEPSP